MVSIQFNITYLQFSSTYNYFFCWLDGIQWMQVRLERLKGAGQIGLGQIELSLGQKDQVVQVRSSYVGLSQLRLHRFKWFRLRQLEFVGVGQIELSLGKVRKIQVIQVRSDQVAWGQVRLSYRQLRLDRFKWFRLGQIATCRIRFG